MSGKTPAWWPATALAQVRDKTVAPPHAAAAASRRPAATPDPNLEQAAALLAQGKAAEAEPLVRLALRAHPGSAAAHNLLGTNSPLLDRSVHYSGLTDESAKQLAEAAERSGMQALL